MWLSSVMAICRHPLLLEIADYRAIKYPPAALTSPVYIPSFALRLRWK
jgi:hypothetical protein